MIINMNHFFTTIVKPIATAIVNFIRNILFFFEQDKYYATSNITANPNQMINFS